jgi:hypothetical protein
LWKKIFRAGNDPAPPVMPTVKTADGQAEAVILKGRLEAENIPVHLSYESTSSVYGFSSTDLGRVDIMVPAAFESAARVILGCKESADPLPPGGTGNEAA